ncbi:hypothetical protein Bca52824_015849 [Brassica carinata]|uniref:Uncharacterized protein n=1 Tax=Brassica carinata TaxID=52824 RepID=A0A8X7W3D2_BRACI|nr:hypothetical protein Bca52824_015849 [Brassica carinata]
MVGLEAVSPWRSWLSSSIVLSAPVEPLVVSYCSCKLAVMDLQAQISGCYSKSTGTKLFSRGSRKDPSQTSLAIHTDPSCSLRARSVSLDGIGLSPQTPFAVAHTNKCSLLLSFLNFTDHWRNSVLVKSSWLRHGNAGRVSVCPNSLLAPLESIVKLISLSVGVKGKISEPSHPWFLVTGVDTQQLCYLISCYPVPKSENHVVFVGFLVQSTELIQKLQTNFISNVQL